MTHRDRILAVLRQLPHNKTKPRSLPRPVLEGLAKTPAEKRAAAETVQQMISQGDIVPFGGPRNRSFGLRRGRGA